SDNWHIVLVDNASSDQTIEKAQSLGLAISIVANMDNYGFGGAVNQAAKLAEGETLVLLNPDTIASPGALDELARALGPEGVGAVGGLLVDSSRSPQKGFTLRGFPTLGSAVSEVLLLNRLWRRNPWNRQYRCLDLDYTRVQDVEQPAGACIAIKQKAWQEVGGFDTDFFPVWFED